MIFDLITGSTPQEVDPFAASVILLTHMDGTNGGTVFTDQTGKTITAFGNASTSTLVKKFGTAAGSFDGAGDYLTVDNVLSQLATGDFTIEFHCRMNALNTGTILSGRPSATSHGILVIFDPARGFVFYFGDTDSSGWEINSSTGNAGIVENIFYHVAMVRLGIRFTIYLNGVGIGGADWAGTIGPILATTTVGADVGATSPFLNGHIDELRITKAARYSANFTPPTAPYPNP